MKRIVVLISGTGSNLAALLRASSDPSYGAKVVAVVADRPAPGLKWATTCPTHVLALANYPSRADWDRALARTVAQYKPDLVVCAGFMKLLGADFLAAFPGKVINTHPALLPAFPGTHGIGDALAYGVKITGATLFYVDAGVDTGKIIAQVAVPVCEGDTEQSLTARLKKAETEQLVREVGRLSSRA